MRIAAICLASALALGLVHSHAVAQSPPPKPRPTHSEVEQARNTYIFRFRGSVDRGRMHGIAQRLAAAAGGQLRHVYDNVFGGFAARLPGAAVWRIASDPDIVSFERDQVDTIAARDWCTAGHWKCPTAPGP